jgi:hypothetical protein
MQPGIVEELRSAAVPSGARDQPNQAGHYERNPIMSHSPSTLQRLASEWAHAMTQQGELVTGPTMLLVDGVRVEVLRAFEDRQGNITTFTTDGHIRHFRREQLETKPVPVDDTQETLAFR